MARSRKQTHWSLSVYQVQSVKVDRWDVQEGYIRLLIRGPSFSSKIIWLLVSFAV